MPGAIRVAFVDDARGFLDGLLQASLDLMKNEPDTGAGLDLRPMLATATNHLIDELNRWERESGWRPDLLCIDLYEASGKGIAGTEYLKILRCDPRWSGLPVVLTTTSENPAEEGNKSGRDLVHTVFSAGADGYLLGKSPSRRYLRHLRQQLPAWHHQARNRVWRNILEENRSELQEASSIEASRHVLQRTLLQLKPRLGIDHAFLRRGPFANCPVWVRAGGDWAEQRPVSDLAEIPLMASVSQANGTVTRVQKIKPTERGPYHQLDGKAYMGCALRLQDRFLGVMTVVCEQPDSFGPLDEDNFQRLAEQVAFTLGTQELEQQRRTLRDRLLQFSEALSSTRDEASVGQALAQVAHSVIHDELPSAKATVRLVEPGYPWLRRYGHAGKVLVSGEDIPLRLKDGDRDSMFRQAVTEARLMVAHTPEDLMTQHHLDRNINEKGQAWWTTRSAITVPLVLERPDSTREQPARSALGAINLECDQPGRYRSEEVQSFLNSLALTAARQITSLRTARFAQLSLDLAVGAYSAMPDDLWLGVDRTLFALLGHQLLVLLEPPPNWDGHSTDTAWAVKRVYSSDSQRFSTDVERWSQHFSDATWPSTFTRYSIEEFVKDPTAGSRFTADRNKFVQSRDLLSNEFVDANAVVPLRQPHGEPARLSGVLLLSWFSPPVMDKGMFDQVLNGFARYCALLLQHSVDRQTGAARLQLAEDQAAIAFAARQFEHVLNNRLASLQGTTEAGLIVTNLDDAKQSLHEVRKQLKQLGDMANKRALYLRDPQRADVSLAKVWADVIAELADKAAQHDVSLWPWGQSPLGGLGISGTTTVKSDEAYLWNALYVLVDNAIEALAELARPDMRHVWTLALEEPATGLRLEVHDNGPGVSDPTRLFCWGQSSKTKGQGIALALARERLSRAHLTLEHRRVEGGMGAIFVIGFPPVAVMH